ncbi:hypothetical protein MMC10_002299 [Thelotrema lepadinum]|nr:hypothetical protein [Thelotrema lepadinum]
MSPKTPSRSRYFTADKSHSCKYDLETTQKVVQEGHEQGERYHAKKEPGPQSSSSLRVVRTETLFDPFVDSRGDGTGGGAEVIFLKQIEVDDERIERADREDRLDAMWTEEMNDRANGYILAALDLRLEKEMEAVQRFIRKHEIEKSETKAVRK